MSKKIPKDPKKSKKVKDADDDGDTSGEDLFAKGFYADYKELLEQPDAPYDPEFIDENSDIDDDLTLYDRRRISKMLDLRDIKEKQQSTFSNPVDIETISQDLHLNDEDLNFDSENLENVTGSISDWVKLPGPRKEIAKMFKDFLTSFVEDESSEESFYYNKIKEMVLSNSQSLHVSYKHLSTFSPLIALWLSSNPKDILEILDNVTTLVVLELFENYSKIQKIVKVRITDFFLEETIRDLSNKTINKLVKISGVITKRTPVFPELIVAKFKCLQCGSPLGPFSYKDISYVSCPYCGNTKKFETIGQESIYRNYQKVTLQETQEQIKAGRIARQKEVILTDDLVDSVRPGTEVKVTGIHVYSIRSSFSTNRGYPVFTTVLEANSIDGIDDPNVGVNITREDEKKILELSKDPRIVQKIINSVAPSIYEMEDVKTAVAVALFGGVEKVIESKHRIRGDINVLLLGDPSTSKSQILKYVTNIANRAVYATGKGASGVGLTAAVVKDPLSKEWVLEAGALVLADKGVCVIDEFDKMNEQDRVAIHEAMEQQTISIAKAGNNATLSARCTVIAAANPINGKYMASRSFKQNVNLSEPILSRFDILLVIKDVVDYERDTKLARFVIDSHRNAIPENQEFEERDDDLEERPSDDPDTIPPDLLRKYIIYARDTVRPSLRNVDSESIVNIYTMLRKKSERGGVMSITPRHMESMIRIAESFAKMHLRSQVIDEDIKMAIKVMLNSFILTQKLNVQKSMRKQFASYLNYKVDDTVVLLTILRRAFRDKRTYLGLKYGTSYLNSLDKIDISCKEFEMRAREVGIHNLESFYANELSKRGYYIEDGRIYAEQ